MFKSIKEKLLSTITAHPRLVTLGIGLAITFVIGTAIGIVDNNQAFAFVADSRGVANASHSS
jgi:hypothetical protein